MSRIGDRLLDDALNEYLEAAGCPCRRCGDTDRFADGYDSVCATCGLTRWGALKP